MSVARATQRLGTMRRHLNALALDEKILFPTEEVAPTQFWGYTVQMDVRHDEKIIDFVTEAMCPNEKKNVYLPQKKLMREMYPEYLITEKHT